MPSPLRPITSPAPHGGTGELGWLLVAFVEELPGVHAAVLGTLDGLALASAGLTPPQDDQFAAVATSQHSAGKAGGNITDPAGGDVQLVIVQLAHKTLFVMNTQQGEGPDTAAQPSLLTVVAARDADPRMVGSEMTKLIASVAPHLGAATRTSPSVNSSGSFPTGGTDAWGRR
ncbi:roadblock/LC7 domain-containing protein [Actinomadura sp. NPDC023710]|uniref:roadblock/LC7 domain-containing protein n=1 Tax=Actinomadura sp. NPDC023710 TaxID=3158219 RepID=UPI0033EE835E